MKNKIFSALSAALLLCLFAAGCGSNDTVDCPDLVGKSYGYVSAAEQYADIVLSVTYDKSDADDAGRITSQDVKPGTKIKRGSTVPIHVSLGKEKKSVPDVAGLESNQAAQKITDAGFNPVIVYAASSDYAEGKCSGTSPAAGSDAAIGSDVSVNISLGKKRSMKKYVSLVGLNEQSAKDKILAEGLNIGRITYEESTEGQTSGTVMEQYPGYVDSLEIAEGSKVDLVIAK